MSLIQAQWIQAFHAVALSGTTVGAAELLGIGQPAVSRHVASLERRLGVRLFDREQRGLRLTAEGETLLGEAATALDSLTRFERVGAELRHMKRGHLTLIASSPIARGLLPVTMRRFRDANPDVTLSLETVPRRELARRLDAQTFDLGFVALPCAYPDEGLFPITGFSGLCILPPGHPLEREASLPLARLQDEPLIALPQGTVWRTRVESAFDEAGLRFEPVIEAYTEIADLVRVGLGLAIVDPFTAMTAAMSGVPARPVEPGISYEMAMLFPVARPRSRLAALFAEAATAVARSRWRAI